MVLKDEAHSLIQKEYNPYKAGRRKDNAPQA